MITMKGILIFAGGIAVGVVCGIYVEKRKYERILDEMEDEVRDGYINKINEPTDKETSEKDAELTSFQRKGSFATNYQAFYKGPDPALNEAPKEEMKAKKKPPKPIKNEEFGTTGFREVYLDYYTEDQTLVIADETKAKEVDEVKDFIGDVLERFDFANNDDQEIICVRNYDRNWDIKIQKVYDRFSPSEYADEEE